MELLSGGFSFHLVLRLKVDVINKLMNEEIWISPVVGPLICVQLMPLPR